MLSSPFKKLLLVMLLAAMGAALLLQFIDSKLKPQEKAPPKISKSDFAYHYTPPALPIATGKLEAEPEADLAEPPKLPRDKVEAWLAKHNRNATSLLAAFRALGDTNYLNEAATNFPDDPHVELAVLARDEFPADRRKWLDLFKASSPSNSLANYFSAEDDFKNGKTDEAEQELLAASGKSQFDNHTMDAQLDAEELYLDSGKSPMDAATFALSAMAEEDLPEMATIKRVDNGIGDLMKQKMNSGDAGSAANLAQMGLVIADRLNSGDSGKLLINQLVSLATVAIVLQHLDQNTAYDFLGGQTPSQVSQALKQQKAAFSELSKSFQAARPSLTDAELNNYFQRSRIYGEIAARQWVVQQHPPVNPSN
jgi:hypothetical protein